MVVSIQVGDRIERSPSERLLSSKGLDAASGCIAGLVALVVAGGNGVHLELAEHCGNIDRHLNRVVIEHFDVCTVQQLDRGVFDVSLSVTTTSPLPPAASTLVFWAAAGPASRASVVAAAIIVLVSIVVLRVSPRPQTTRNPQSSSYKNYIYQ